MRNAATRAVLLCNAALLVARLQLPAQEPPKDTARTRADTSARPKRDSIFGTYAPLKGFKIANTDQGDVSFKLYAYVRYLNQLGLDEKYTDGFGIERNVRLRQDVQFQKVNLQFLGWFLDEKFRYFVYTWTANTSQGLGAQVVVGGNLIYNFKKEFALGGGIGSLPGVRATEGNFPLWLTVDNRLIADEFFRPSYTMGLWVRGNVRRFEYQAMLGNNLSQLGVDAGQLDKRLNTVSGVVVWMPTTGEFGPQGAFGDYENHKKLATRIGLHFTRSNENFQGQANTDQFENVQIRLSDGSIIFTPDLFGPGIRVTDARYQMASVDGGLKYHGFALEGEHYWRGVNEFVGPGTAGLRPLWDHGFQLQASAMAIQRRFQLYVSHSKVFGQFGNPWDTRLGGNVFPFPSRGVRWNTELLWLRKSPVGGLSLPYPVGGNGLVMYSSFEVNF